ncbi:MAG: C-terminal target protein [Chlorobi bacterium]|nr:C-terminal target protein [Chlorobiota bacterium]
MSLRCRFYLVIAVLLLAGSALVPSLHAQSWHWARGAGGSGTDVVGGIAVDSLGNTFVVGTFDGNIAFGNIIFTNGSNAGLFLVKYNADGTLLWARQVGGTGSIQNPSISATKSGDVFICGSFVGQISFGTARGDTLNSVGKSDIFLANYNTSGTKQWIHRDGGGADEYVRGIAVNSSLDIFVTGYFRDSLRYDTNNIKSRGGTDAYVAKYNGFGVLRWVTRLGDKYNEESYAISLDNLGTPFIVGQFSDTTVFGIDSLISKGGTDGFISKISSTGGLNWTKRVGGKLNDVLLGVNGDRGGNAVVTGSISDTVAVGADTLMGTGNTDIVVAKFDGQGGVRWARRAGGKRQDVGLAVTSDQLGDIYVTGRYADTVAFDTLRLIDTAKSGNIFVTKYLSGGQVGWVRQAGGPLFDEGRVIDVDASGELRVAGGFSGQALFGTTKLTSTGQVDLFVARIGPDPSITTGSIIEAPFCPGAQFNVPFSFTSVFNTGNVFTAQLSDSSGSFALPVAIGKLFGAAGSTIVGKIPDTTHAGTHYRIRVVSSDPPITGIPNGADITIYPAPVAVISPAGPVTICRGDSVTLDAGAGPYTYQWITTATTRKIVVKSSGEYSVTIRNDGGCTSTSAIVKVMVVTAAAPSIALNGNTLEATPAAGYAWSVDGSSIAGATGRTYAPTKSGSYVVTITDSSGCTAASLPFAYTFSGVDYEADAKVLSVYPHPTTGLFTVRFTPEHEGMVAVTITGASGERVANFLEHADGGEYRKSIDIRSFPAGVYFVRVEQGSRTWVRKVVKE